MKTLNQLVAFAILFFFLYSNYSNAQYHIDDWTAIKSPYESTDGDEWNDNIGWEEVGSDSNNCENDLAVLTILREISGGLWNEGQSPDTWRGVTINELGCVTELNLADLFFSGNIPPELGSLSELKILDLNENYLTGSIPPELGNLSNLIHLGLARNQLSGNIPLELFNLSNLTRLSLENNQLSGNIHTAQNG